MESEEGTSINQATYDVTSDTHPLVGGLQRIDSSNYHDPMSETTNRHIQVVGESDLNGDIPSLQRAKARLITIELPVALTCLIFQMLTTLETEYIHDRISADFNSSLDANSTVCNINGSSTSGSSADDVQSETSRWLFYLGLSYSVPNLFSIVILGSMSDRYGRKPAIALSILGVLWRSVVDILIIHFHLPVPVFLVSTFVCGLSGGTNLVLAAGNAYITDVSSLQKRTFRIIILQSCVLISTAIGQITLGITLQMSTDNSYAKYMLPLYLAVGCTTASFIYVVLPELIIETIDRQSAWGEAGVVKVISALGDLLKDNTDGRRLKLLGYCTLFLFADIVITSQMKIVIVYGLGEPYCLSPLMIAYLVVIGMASPAIGMIVGGALFSRFLSDNWILQISLWNNVIFCLAIGFARSTLVLFIGAASGLFDPLFFPVLRSIMSKLANANELGLMQALLECVDSIASILVPIIANNIYSATVYYFPPFLFFFLAGLEVIPIILTGILQCQERTEVPYEDVQEADE